MVVPPLTLHSPCPSLLAPAWMALRETLVCGRVERSLKEAVAAAVSRTNACSYCVDAHVTMLHASDSHDVARSIARGRDDRLDQHKIRALAEWAGHTRTPAAKTLADPPFSPDEAPEIMGTALVFHYINRLVQVFVGDSPVPMRNTIVGSTLRWLVGFRFASAVRASHAPGESLVFAPAATPPLPADLTWAAASPTTASALACWVAAVEEAGGAVLDGPSRSAVDGALALWDGSEPALGRGWLDAALSGLDAEPASAVRLCLLTALAPARVTGDDVAGFRRYRAADADLVAALAWASQRAARRTLGWCPAPRP